MVRLQVGEEVDRDDLLRRFVQMQYTRNDLAFTRGTFRVRGDTVEIIPVYEELARAHRVLRRRDRARSTRCTRSPARSCARSRRCTSSPPRTTSPARSGWSAPSPASSSSWRTSSALFEQPGQAARGPAAADAHHLRHRDDAPGRLLLGHRELLDAHRRPAAGHRPQLPHRLLPRGLPPRHRRVARHRPADRGDVRGRHVPQAHARRPRLPAALGDGQPPAEVGGVPRADRPDRLPLGDPGPYELAKAIRRRRADHPADRPDRPRDRPQADQGPDRRPAPRDPHRAPSATSASSSRR